MKAFYGAIFVLAAFAAPVLAARTVSQEGYNLIKGFEGCVLTAYQ